MSNSIIFFFLQHLKWLLFPCILLLVLMTLPSSASQACAACKYQRRRCTSECPLAPHFPADDPKMFQNAHRLFGVANMSRIIKQIRVEDRGDCMQSIKFESNMWVKFPYLGCVAVINQLLQETLWYKDELVTVQNLIDAVKNHGLVINPSNESGSSSMNMDPNIYRASSSKTLTLPQALQFREGRGVVIDYGIDYDMEVKPKWIREQFEDVEAQYVSEALAADDDIQQYNGSKEPLLDQS